MRNAPVYRRHVSPSGLIFLVIVGVWAAYFTQYWIRRREHLSTARSMDRFSESMRVLARRAPRSESSAASSTYAMSSARPRILVTRADEMAAATPAPRGDEMASESVGSGGSAPTPDDPRPSRGSSSPAFDRRPVVADRAPRRRSSRPVRAALGLLLLASVVAAFLIAALVPFTTFLWWAPVVALLPGVGALVGLRALARVDRSRVKASRVARPATSRSGVDRGGLARDLADHDEPLGDQLPERTGDEPAADDDPRSEVYDGDPEPVPHTPAPGQLVDEDDIPLTWDPRPVPPPTYTMKARVERPQPSTVTPEPVAAVPADDDIPDDVPVELASRRRAAGA